MLYSPTLSTAERGKRDEPSVERQADHEKRREKQRVAVSEGGEREREREVGERV